MVNYKSLYESYEDDLLKSSEINSMATFIYRTINKELNTLRINNSSINKFKVSADSLLDLPKYHQIGSWFYLVSNFIRILNSNKVAYKKQINEIENKVIEELKESPWDLNSSIKIEKFKKGFLVKITIK